MISTIFTTAHNKYTVKEILGKGKSGLSYLIEDGQRKYVLKLIHNEKCPYYEFSDKMLSEIDAYEKLLKSGIKIPELIEFNYEKKYLIKEYVDGISGSELIASNSVTEDVFAQLFDMYCVLKKINLNIDYFPSNFVAGKEHLYYIDYEVNPYSKEWDLENWGIYYWLNNKGMKQFLESGDASFINESLDKGIPYKTEFEQRAKEIIRKFEIIK